MTAQVLDQDDSPKPVSFDKFIEWLPESSEHRYELHRGAIKEMLKPRGKHSDVAGYAAKKVNYAIDAAESPLHKLADYEALSIQEYWIADYAALGGRRFIGNPKQPTFTIASLVDGEYELQTFKTGDRILSPTFPKLNLTVDQVFAAGQ